MAIWSCSPSHARFLNYKLDSYQRAPSYGRFLLFRAPFGNRILRRRLPAWAAVCLPTIYTLHPTYAKYPFLCYGWLCLCAHSATLYSRLTAYFNGIQTQFNCICSTWPLNNKGLLEIWVYARVFDVLSNILLRSYVLIPRLTLPSGITVWHICASILWHGWPREGSPCLLHATQA